MRRRFKSSNEEQSTIATGGKADLSPNNISSIRRGKRVKFVDTEPDSLHDHASSRRHEATHSPTDAPKTSEYAYFRNVRNKSVRGHSHSLYKENQQSKSIRTNSLIRETSNASGMLKPSTENFRCSAAEEITGSPKHHHLLSPHVSKHDKPGRLRSEDPTNIAKRTSQMLNENVTPVRKHSSTPPLNEEVEISGNQCIQKGIFSARRRRLYQWVAQTSFPEVQKLHPKGLDLVASLLSRLLPNGDESHDSSPGQTNNSKSPPFHESNNPEKGLILPHSSKWNEDLPKYHSGNSSEFVLRDPGFSLSNRGRETHFLGEIMDLDPCSESRRTRRPRPHHEFVFSLPLERYESSGTYHVEELDERCFPVEHAIEEPHRLLLEWDLEREKYGVDSSIVRYDSAEKLSPRLATSWLMDDVFDSKTLRLGFDSMPNYQSTSCLFQDFRSKFDFMKYPVTADQFSPQHIRLEENQNEENTLYSNNSIILPYRDQYWLKDKSWGWKPYNDFSPKSSYALDSVAEYQGNKTSLCSFERLGEASQGLVIPFFKGELNNPFLSSDFQPFLDGLVNHPLSRYDTSKYRPVKDFHFDCDDELLYS